MTAWSETPRPVRADDFSGADFKKKHAMTNRFPDLCAPFRILPGRKFGMAAGDGGRMTQPVDPGGFLEPVFYPIMNP